MAMVTSGKKSGSDEMELLPCVLREREKYRANYYRNIDTHKASTLRWQRQNPEKVEQYKRISYGRHRDEILQKLKQNYANNRNHLLTQSKKYYHDNVEQIKESDRYARILLCSGTILEPADIPDELVKLKLAQIKLKRIIKKGD